MMSPRKKEFVVVCPHCQQPVIIAEINCAIFRHGVLVATGAQIDPHLCMEKCDELVSTDQIVGCGRPFRVVMENGEYVAIVCEYI